MNALTTRTSSTGAASAPALSGYNYAYLDEQTKRMIRRATLKAVAIPGFQVPFGSREMPIPYGWGTGGIQLTASLIGEDDVFKCIDQGADDTTNAVSIRNFFAKVAAVATTENTESATIIQSRHRFPEHLLKEGQILVFQVPQPEPLRRFEARETETRAMHAYREYSLPYVGLYESFARLGRSSATASHPVLTNERYVMTPSPIPSFDNPKLHECQALQLYGAGREKRIYAVPPYTSVVSLHLEDKPFQRQRWGNACELCGSTESYLDEVITDDKGGRMYVCSDTYFCATMREAGHVPAGGHEQ
jgi:alpha-D-ribose 1-methylphosphonate 5-phosphate C-P lyase